MRIGDGGEGREERSGLLKVRRQWKEEFVNDVMLTYYNLNGCVFILMYCFTLTCWYHFRVCVVVFIY